MFKFLKELFSSKPEKSNVEPPLTPAPEPTPVPTPVPVEQYDHVPAPIPDPEPVVVETPVKKSSRTKKPRQKK